MRLKLVFNAERTAILALDRASVRTFDQDGHLHVASSVISAAEVDSYLGAEIPDCGALGLNPRATYQVFRDPVELEKAVPTFQGKPLLSRHRVLDATDHPHGVVIGSVINPTWRAPSVIAELVVWRADAIEAITSGETSSLSAGYRYTPVLDRGSYQGSRYSIRMTRIAANHVALCPEGRVSTAIVGDEADPTMIRLAATRLARSLCQSEIYLLHEDTERS
jgi:uncharacterized protein